MFQPSSLLTGALAKVQQNLTKPDTLQAYTQAEIEALEAWLTLELAVRGKETRAERSERNRLAWNGGDRRQWGGERRKRDKRRGWRNFKGA